MAEFFQYREEIPSCVPYENLRGTCPQLGQIEIESKQTGFWKTYALPVLTFASAILLGNLVLIAVTGAKKRFKDG